MGYTAFLLRYGGVVADKVMFVGVSAGRQAELSKAPSTNRNMHG